MNREGSCTKEENNLLTILSGKGVVCSANACRKKYLMTRKYVLKGPLIGPAANPGGLRGITTKNINVSPNFEPQPQTYFGGWVHVQIC